MRSLQLKFSALVVTLLIVASVSLAWIATRHERAALEGEVEKRGRHAAKALAETAREPLARLGHRGSGPQRTLDELIANVAKEQGVSAVRLLGREGRIAASLDAEERESIGSLLTSPAGATSDTSSPDRFLPDELQVVRERERLRVAAPIVSNGVQLGEAQIEFDLTILIDPIVRSNAKQLGLAALAVVVLGVLAGGVFVAMLVGPLRRLRVGVEQMTAGEFSVRVPPTSRDEVGELTRAFNNMGDGMQQKDRIQSAFGRYVNDFVLAQLLDGKEDEPQVGIEREVTLLFADIRGFTNLSEGLEAPTVVSLLNEIFQIASDCILEHGGTIDKYMGDSVMAYFGAPVTQTDHSLRGVTAAIDILAAVNERNLAIRAAAGREQLAVDLGIGLHTGVVVVGNIGSDRKTDFTAVGDAVNVAQRLEKLAKGGEILVSEAVWRRVRGSIEMRFEGERQLSGRQEPIHVYSIARDETQPSDTGKG